MGKSVAFSDNENAKPMKLVELKNDEVGGFSDKTSKKKKSKMSLEERLASEEHVGEVVTTETGHTMTFQTEKPRQVVKKEEEDRRHRQERRMVRRSAKSLKKDKLPPRFWMGKRVR